MELHLNRYRSIICLDGLLPIPFLKNTQLPIIAADGAANILVAHHIAPSMIIGDCDSVSPEILNRYPSLQIRDQSTTDFEKAIDYVQKTQQTPFMVAGINGGCVDRILDNISVFSQTNALFVSEAMFGLVLKETTQLQLPQNTKMSLFGCPQCTITSQGLKWELNAATLTFGGLRSVSNRVQTSPITLQTQGTALLFIYRNAIQDAGSLG